MSGNIDRLCDVVEKLRSDGLAKSRPPGGGRRAGSWRRSAKPTPEVGGDALERACLRLREARSEMTAGPEPSPVWAMVSIERVGGWWQPTAYVRIDGRRLGILPPGRTKEFRIRAGERRLSVGFGARDPGEMLEATFEPGQRLDLVYECRSRWRQTILFELALMAMTGGLSLAGISGIGFIVLAAETWKLGRFPVGGNIIFWWALGVGLLGLFILGAMWDFIPRGSWRQPLRVTSLKRKRNKKPFVAEHPLADGA